MSGKVVAERRYWFPLVLLGFGLLGVLASDIVRPAQDIGWFAYSPLPAGSSYVDGDNVVTAVVRVGTPSSLGWQPVQDWRWVLLVTATLVATMAWYGWRSRRAGDPAGEYVALAVGGGIAVPVGYVFADMTAAAADPAGVVTPVGLPLVVLGGLGVVWARTRLGTRWRAVVLAAGVGCLVVGLATVLGAWLPGLYLPVVITGGLLALARFERSRLLALVAVAVLGALLAFPHGELGALIPAVIVPAAAIAALVRRPAAAA